MNSDTMQKLINELQRHCDDVAEAEDKTEPQLVTPIGIKFWVPGVTRVAGMFFNGNKQLLKYCDISEQFEVCGIYEQSIYLTDAKESLPMTPCKYEDLKPGEFFSIMEGPKHGDIRLRLPHKNAEGYQVHVLAQTAVTDFFGVTSNVWRIGK